MAAIEEYLSWLNNVSKSYNATSKYEHVLLDMIRIELPFIRKRQEQYEIISNLKKTKNLSALWSLFQLKNIHYSKLQILIKVIAQKYRTKISDHIQNLVIFVRHHRRSWNLEVWYETGSSPARGLHPIFVCDSFVSSAYCDCTTRRGDLGSYINQKKTTQYRDCIRNKEKK